MKLSAVGTMLWHTFLGSADSEPGSSGDQGAGIAVDPNGRIYVAGTSAATWGTPLRGFAGGLSDPFIAKLDTDGNLGWNTFLGGDLDEKGKAIAVDPDGNVYAAGGNIASRSSATGKASPDHRAFVAKLNTDGKLQWNAYLSGATYYYASGVAVDPGRNIYVVGTNSASWLGTLASPSAVVFDAFVAKFNTTGTLQWNISLGGEDHDYGWSVAVDPRGSVYAAGSSCATWGLPIRRYTQNADPFVAVIKEGYDLTVASGPHGTTNPAPGTYLYSSGNTASVSAVADSGYVFDKWTGDVPAGQETATTVSILMDAPKSIQANFKGGHNLSIGSGPHGTTDPAPGTYSYDAGSTASVSAIPDNDSVFDKWTGDVPAGQETLATVSILMDAEKSIRANFKKLYKLTIASGPHGTTIPAPGTYSYDPGSFVSVSATPESDSVFDQWTGDVPAGQETSATVSVLMNAGKSIYANFKLVNPPSNLAAVRLMNRSLSQVEYIVDLSWAANSDNTGLSITTYRVYQMSGNSWIKLADLSSNELSYRVRNVPTAEQTFGVASVTAGGVESAKITVSK
ncbi:MAG: SBBP repeat-containing protein [Candidatus Aminicenantes bacterium]|nr:SBBP repeat-containing protein [Candidatus Aminicenantes bacterium]